jgi:hypothetical protein
LTKRDVPPAAEQAIVVRLLRLGETRLRLLQILGIEAFGEPMADRHEQFMRVLVFAWPHQSPERLHNRQAVRNARLPKRDARPERGNLFDGFAFLNKCQARRPTTIPGLVGSKVGQARNGSGGTGGGTGIGLGGSSIGTGSSGSGSTGGSPGGPGGSDSLIVSRCRINAARTASDERPPGRRGQPFPAVGRSSRRRDEAPRDTDPAAPRPVP